VAAPRPFRFGVHASSPESAEGWRDQARRIEALGYSALLVPDHFVGTPLAVVPALAFAAEATTTLRIGMLVLGNDYRHPAVVAKEAATLDVLSGGRLEFGLGAGWLRADYDALGIPYDPASAATTTRSATTTASPSRSSSRIPRSSSAGAAGRCCSSPAGWPTSSA
jgi:alkanesulfonate monooxygenase SsuD/methylene tetrahydromethanopterin reductase-like flavin-dependent oxidoreductase (luciferase family)